MPTIKVSTSRLGNYESDMQGILSRVNSITNQFNSVSRNLDWDIRAASNINSRLSGISRELSAEYRGINGMKNYLGTARAKYDAVEKKNSGRNLKNENSGNGGGMASWQINKDNLLAKETGAVGATSQTGYKPDWANGIFKTVARIGNVGSYAGSVYTLGKAISSGDSSKVTKGLISFSKDYISRFGSLASGSYSGTSVKQTLFGDWTKGGAVNSLFTTVGEATSATKGTIFKAAWAKELNAFSFKNATNVGSKIKVGTKWAGTALSGVTNLIGNIEEQKKTPGMSNARVVSETVVETALDIGIAAVVTAGATALIGAAAPAVVVGAATVGTIWAINTVTEAATARYWGEDNKKNFTELLSDGLIDGATAVGKGVGKAGKSGMDALTKWGKSLSGV